MIPWGNSYIALVKSYSRHDCLTLDIRKYNKQINLNKKGYQYKTLMTVIALAKYTGTNTRFFGSLYKEQAAMDAYKTDAVNCS